MSKRRKADGPPYTVAEINRFLNRCVSRRNYVRDAVENVWIVADKSHSGKGRGFHVVARDGTWSRVVIEPLALN